MLIRVWRLLPGGQRSLHAAFMTQICQSALHRVLLLCNSLWLTPCRPAHIFFTRSIRWEPHFAIVRGRGFPKLRGLLLHDSTFIPWMCNIPPLTPPLFSYCASLARCADKGSHHAVEWQRVDQVCLHKQHGPSMYCKTGTVLGLLLCTLLCQTFPHRQVIKGWRAWHANLCNVYLWCPVWEKTMCRGPWTGFLGGQLHSVLDPRLTLWKGYPTANPV